MPAAADHGARRWDALVETCLDAQQTDGLLPDQHGAKPGSPSPARLDRLPGEPAGGWIREIVPRVVREQPRRPGSPSPEARGW